MLYGKLSFERLYRIRYRKTVPSHRTYSPPALYPINDTLRTWSRSLLSLNRLRTSAARRLPHTSTCIFVSPKSGQQDHLSSCLLRAALVSAIAKRTEVPGDGTMCQMWLANSVATPLHSRQYQLHGTTTARLEDGTIIVVYQIWLAHTAQQYCTVRHNIPTYYK